MAELVLNIVFSRYSKVILNQILLLLFLYTYEIYNKQRGNFEIAVLRTKWIFLKKLS
jgi:hypothetical protein